MDTRIHVFCDFDGTVAASDVGYLMFRRFSGPVLTELLQAWKEGKLSSVDYYLREFEVTRVTPEQLEAFVKEQTLDPHFAEFVGFAGEHDIGVEIVSDGFDFYIERILRNHGLDQIVGFYSNVLSFLDHDRVAPSFPYAEHSCGRCANCKGYHVRKAKESGFTVIYVGDGMSDRCGAEAADYVFAKRGRDLLLHCKEKNIDFFPYDNFADVKHQIKEMLVS